MTRASTITDAGKTMTPDELDAAILAALRSADGELLPWAELRDRLPDQRFWPRVEALVRLVERGQVEVYKDGQGRNYCMLSIRLPARRPRPRSGPAPRTAA